MPLHAAVCQAHFEMRKGWDGRCPPSPRRAERPLPLHIYCEFKSGVHAREKSRPAAVPFRGRIPRASLPPQYLGAVVVGDFAPAAATSNMLLTQLVRRGVYTQMAVGVDISLGRKERTSFTVTLVSPVHHVVSACMIIVTKKSLKR